ncbi:MAG: aspartate aminotransferase family protein [Gemmatimonadetes bacterium]|nr:aspartate aminotransferase family protein [Gemmatimonadota bacterium]
MAARLARVESRNVTYLADDFPVFWSRGEGATVEDADGNIFLDLTGAFGVVLAGHGHPRIVEAIQRQAAVLAHGMGDVHPPVRKLELLERLSSLMPWKEARGILASSGSEAVEIALKAALLATGRSGIVAFGGGYHGLTVGALSVTSRKDFRAPFADRLFQKVRFVPFPDPLRDGAEAAPRSLRALDDAIGKLEAEGSPAGCVIVEPIQGRGGVRIPPPGFLADVARRTRRGGALLVLDEIFTGLGRTGSLFAFQEEGVVPDVLCLGKGLGGGLPLSACFASREVMDAWPTSRGEALHTSTFLGHPLACSASLALLDVLESEGLVERARKEGAWLCGRLREALRGLPDVREVRGRGLLAGIVLASDGAGAGAAVRALREGLIVLPAGEQSNVVELAPPLTIARAQLEWAVGALVRTLTC